MRILMFTVRISMALVYPPNNFELVGSETQTRLHKSAGSPEPSLNTFVISTSPHGFIMLGSSDSKKKKREMINVHSVEDTHACAFSSFNSRQEEDITLKY